jgi:hypothetical protein
MLRIQRIAARVAYLTHLAVFGATPRLGFQPYFESGFPHGHDQWISQAGTALAATALTFAVK